MIYNTTTVHVNDLSDHLDIHAQDGWVLNTILPLPSKDMSVVCGATGLESKGIVHSHFLVIMEKEETIGG